VGGRGPPRYERERVVAAQAGGGWRAPRGKENSPMVKGDKERNPIHD